MIKNIKRKKWDKENIVSLEEKERNCKIHKQETKEYRGIEYNLISLVTYSGRKWVALESNFKFPKFLIYDLTENFDFLHDFLYCDSGIWDEYPIEYSIEYQWKKMEKSAKEQIDALYKLHDDIDKILTEKISELTKISTNFKDFIGSLGSE